MLKKTYFNNPISQKNFLTFEKIVDPKVSVVLPTYNHGDFLLDSVNSVLNQTYRNLELVIVNDGSTDQTENILDLLMFDNRIKIINQKNSGLPVSLNVGFENSDGDYLTWTSADNLMKPEALSRLVKELNNDNSVGLVYGDYEVIDEFGKGLELENSWRIYERNYLNPSIIKLPKSKKLYRNIPVNHVGPYFLYRRELKNALNRYANIPGIEDWDYWLRMQFITKFKHINNVDTYYKYRVHGNSLSAKLDILQNMQAIFTLLVKIVTSRIESLTLDDAIDPTISEDLYMQMLKKNIK